MNEFLLCFAHVIPLGALGQEDPLSPYLFVMRMDVFSLLIKKVVNGGFILGHSIRGKNGFDFSFSLRRRHTYALQGLI